MAQLPLCQMAKTIPFKSAQRAGDAKMISNKRNIFIDLEIDY